MKQNKRTKWHFAWLVLIGVTLIRGFAGGGINSSSGLFLSPVSNELGIGIGELSLYLSISSIVMFIWLPIAGKIVNKYDIRLIVIIGALLQAGSFIGFGFMDSVWGWYILAIPNAMGATLLVNILGPVLINRWFTKNTGLAIGIMMAFVGIFGAVLQPLATNLIVSSGWRYAYMTIGFVTLLVVVIATLLFTRSNPKDKNMKPYGYEENITKQEVKQVSRGVEASRAKKSSAFYLLVLFMVALTGLGVFTQHISTYGLQLGYSMNAIGMALSLSMIGSAVGSLLIGILSDKMGALKTSILMIIVGVIAIALFLISDKGFGVFGLATFLHGLTASSIGVLAPILTLSFFGTKDYEKLFSNVMMGSPLASIILVPAYGFIYDALGGYQVVFIFLLVMMIVALLSIRIGFKNSRKLLSESNIDKESKGNIA